MPDIAAAQRFVAQISRHERRIVATALAAWQQARPALADALASGSSAAVFGVLAQTGASVATHSAATRAEAAQSARTEAIRQLRAAQAPITAQNGAQLAVLDLSAWQAATAGRMLTDVQRLVAAGESAEAIALELTAARGLARQSAWQWGATALQLAAEAALWQQVNADLRQVFVATEAAGVVYQKQLIAAIDGRTTSCCLQAHGQIVDLDQPFVLTGTPRYADRMQQPPFHHRCRSVITLHTPAMESIGITTDQLRADARARQSSRTR